MKSRVLLAAAVAGAMVAPAMAQVGITPMADAGPMPTFGYSGRKGKGKGKHPHHSSNRFVAMDKRAARKARNRRG